MALVTYQAITVQELFRDELYLVDLAQLIKREQLLSSPPFLQYSSRSSTAQISVLCCFEIVNELEKTIAPKGETISSTNSCINMA